MTVGLARAIGMGGMVAALLALAALPPRAVRADEPAPVAEWTLLVYDDADCDLESPMMDDLGEMIAVGGTDQVNVVVLCDRSPLDESSEDGSYSGADVGGVAAWDTAKVLLAKKGELAELADWGELDLGDPATLARFIEFAAKRFPARRFALMLNDHGMGWPGVCADDSVEGGSHLTLADIQDALERTQATYGGRLELVGFDACLMAAFETAHALARRARYMVASEELEPGSGWQYTAMLETLVRRPTMDGAELGKLICETYRESFDRSDDEDVRASAAGITQSLIDLDRASDLAAKLAVVATKLREQLEVEDPRSTWVKIGRARSRAEEYGGGEGGSGIHDLLHVLDRLRAECPDDGVDDACADAIASLRGCVLYAIRGSARPHACGLSICFPADKALLEDDSGAYATTSFGRDHPWSPFVACFVALAGGDEAAPDVLGVTASAEKISLEAHGTVEITAKVSLDDVDQAVFILGAKVDDECVILGQLATKPDEDGKLSETWDGRWFALRSGEAELLCPINELEEDPAKADTYAAQVPVRWRAKGKTKWQAVTLHLALTLADDDVKGEFVYAFVDTPNGPRAVELEAGDELRAVYLVIDAKGDVQERVTEDAANLLVLAGRLKMGLVQLPPATYQLGFAVTDLAGNTSESAVAVELAK